MHNEHQEDEFVTKDHEIVFLLHLRRLIMASVEDMLTAFQADVDAKLDAVTAALGNITVPAPVVDQTAVLNAIADLKAQIVLTPAQAPAQ